MRLLIILIAVAAITATAIASVPMFAHTHGTIEHTHEHGELNHHHAHNLTR